MKRVLLGLIAVLLVATFAAAGCTSSPAPAAPAGGQAAPAGQSGAPAPAQVIHWKGTLNGVGNVAPFGPFKARQTGVAAASFSWGDWLTKATGGRLVIDWNDMDAIFPGPEALNSVSKHVVDVSVSVGTWHAGTLPEANIDGGLPFAWNGIDDEIEYYLRYGGLALAQEAYAEKNVFFLPQPLDAIVGMGVNFDASTPASIKGKKIRGVGSWNDYTAVLGGSPVTIAWGEIYQGMKLGTFDGWIAGSGAMEDIKLKEVTKGWLGTPKISTAPAEILINMDAYKALPADIQQIIKEGLPMAAFASAYTWHQQNAWVIANAVKEYGVKVYTWPDADQRKIQTEAVNTIYPKIAKLNDRTGKMVAALMQQMRDYGRID